MTDRLIVDLDPDARDLVVEALRTDSVRRQRAATRAAAELHAERASGGRRDIRSGAVMVTALLVDAARLDDAANAIAKAKVVPFIEALIVDERPVLDLDDPAQVAAAKAEAAALPDPPPAPPADADPGGASRSPAEALAETKAVIADLGLAITREDLDGDDDDFLDGRTDEDDPGPLDGGLPAELADLAPQEA